MELFFKYPIDVQKELLLQLLFKARKTNYFKYLLKYVSELNRYFQKIAAGETYSE